MFFNNGLKPDSYFNPNECKRIRQETKNEIEKVENKMNEKITKISDDIHEVQLRMTTLDQLVPMLQESMKGVEASNKKLDSTLIDLTYAVKTLTSNQEESQGSVKSLSSKLDKANERISEVECSLNKKIEQLDDRGKFDIIKWLKDNLVMIIAVIVLVVILLQNMYGSVVSLPK